MSMQHVEPGPSTPTVDLVKEAILDTRELLVTEIELAKSELREEMHRAKVAAIALGAAGGAAFIGLTMVIVSIALAIELSWLPAFLIGLGLLVAGAIGAVVGYNRVPKTPLPRTVERVKTDVRMLKERIA
jgi:uncharacterized membrane protein YqjE